MPAIQVPTSTHNHLERGAILDISCADVPDLGGKNNSSLAIMLRLMPKSVVIAPGALVAPCLARIHMGFRSGSCFAIVLRSPSCVPLPASWFGMYGVLSRFRLGPPPPLTDVTSVGAVVTDACVIMRFGAGAPKAISKPYMLSSSNLFVAGVSPLTLSYMCFAFSHMFGPRLRTDVVCVPMWIPESLQCVSHHVPVILCASC